MNEQQKKQVLEQVKSANNVLVAVNSNPTVDELAAAVGLTLALNKLDKHATTVFSGVVPSTIEFLQPEKTIETTTDSLRDFIIALDKSKADKLRYKVENDVVRIFITPYKSSITNKDLEFSQGDFNVDVVVALGVNKRDDLDKAITAHGRILHDANVLSLTKRDKKSELGSIDWHEDKASSLCEMVADMLLDMQADVLDGQMATAFLTGIIAETDRFRNDKTTPLALSLSSELMSAGANQQLIAEKLEQQAHDSRPKPVHDIAPKKAKPRTQEASPDGTLEIDHDDVGNIHIDEHGNMGSALLQEDQPVDELPQVQDPAAEDSQEIEEVAEEPVQEAPVAYEETPVDDTPEPQEDNAPAEDVDTSEDDNSTSDDVEDKPSPSQSSASNIPMMTHGKTIQPIGEDGQPVQKTDKPFDLQEAMKHMDVTSDEPDTPEPSTAPPASEAEAAPAESPQQEQSLPSQPAGTPAPTESPAQPTPQADPPQPTPAPPVESAPEPAPAPPAPQPDQVIPSDTLAELEKSVGSTHVAGSEPAAASPETPTTPPTPVTSQDDKDSAPPVPPPMTPQFFDSDGQSSNPFLNPNQH